MARQTNNFWIMRVSDRDREMIAALARREGVPAAAAVRTAIQKALKDERAPKDGGALTVSRA